MSFNRSGYIGRAPGDSTITIARKTFEPTGVTTDFTFSAGYLPGYCDAYLNGVKLVNGVDYTASNGSTVGLTSAAQNGDVLELVAYKAFNIGQPLSDITGDLNISNDISAQTVTASTNVSASSSITANEFYGDGSNLTGIDDLYAGIGATQHISSNSLIVIGSPGVSTITRLGATDAVVTGIITANGLSGNVTGAACTFTTAGTFNSDVSIGGTLTVTGSVSVGGTLTYEDVTNVDSVGVVTARSGVNVSGGQLQVGVAYSVGAAGVATAAGFVGPLTGAVTGTTGSFSSNLTVGSGITFGSAGVATFSGTGDVHLHDNVRLNVGDGSDLAIYHDGNNSYIKDAGTGYLVTNADQIHINNADNSDNMIKAIGDGAVEAYYDGTKKWETTNDGTVTTGIATATGGLAINADSKNLTIGAGEDLKLFHNGTNSHIWNATGELDIRSDSFWVRNAANNEDIIKAVADGAVELYYNDSKKIETTNDGTVTTGIATVDGLRLGDNEYISVGAGGTGDLQLSHNGTDSFIQNNTGNLEIRASEFRIRTATSETIMQASINGEVQLWYDNNERFRTTYEGIKISGFTSTSSGMGVTGGLFEGAFIKAGKLSDNKTLGISTANVFYFTTTETTTATPNIVWNDSYALSSKMNVGDVASVTVITTAAAGGYSANWTIDGNAVTEVWAGGSAPSSGGSSGVDVYGLTIIRKASGTGDTGWKVIANVTNCA